MPETPMDPKDSGLDASETLFPMSLKERVYRAANVLPDQVVRIEKRRLQSPCKLPANGGLSPAGHAHKGDWSISQFGFAQLDEVP